MKYGFAGLVKNEFNSNFRLGKLDGDYFVAFLGLNDNIAIWANAVVKVACKSGVSSISKKKSPFLSIDSCCNGDFSCSHGLLYPL
jgi:hypothetical protein